VNMRGDVDDRAAEMSRPFQPSLSESEAERLQSIMLEFYFGRKPNAAFAGVSFGAEGVAAVSPAENETKSAA
jgi:hypothetical protein